MKEILQKIYSNTAKQAVDDILRIYEKQWFVVSNFIYFSIIKVQKLFESTKKTTTQKEYNKAIIKWDYLLPDGIALQSFYYLAQKQFNLPTKRLSNLNWTDFVPFFLDELKKRYGSQRVALLLYWAKEEIVQETKKSLIYKWFNVVYTQNWYSEFDWKKFSEVKDTYKDTINILLVAMSTPTNPIQELRTMKNYSKIKDNHLIIFTVWWLFDFLAADNKNSSIKKWTQKRAPKIVRKAKLEWLWRLITDPKRNYQKVKNSFALFPYILKYLLLKKE